MSSGLPRLSECRDCAEPIRFVRMADTGKALPVNPATNPQGTVCARLVGGQLEGFVISRDRLPSPFHVWRFLPHHATCSALAEQRAAKPAPEPHPSLF